MNRDRGVGYFDQLRKEGMSDDSVSGTAGEGLAKDGSQ
jgi:hypothetical protein